MSEFGGAEFIHKRYSDLQKSEQVQKSVDKKQRLEGIKTPNNPANRDQVFLERLENIFSEPKKKIKERNIELFKNQFLYPNVLIDPNNVPDSYFELQLKIAKETGRGGDLGNIREVKDISQEVRKKSGDVIHDDQKHSLDIWIDYLNSRDTTFYPTWFKYYTIRSILTMGAYDKEKHEFGKRTKNTIAIFPDLNREALSYTYDILEKHYLKHEKHNDEELNRILDSANFSKIYAFSVEKATPSSKENKEKTEGEWIKYNEGDDPTPLCESLQGHGTDWCTAGQVTAEEQLDNGDFYVYYSKDEKGKNTIPRIAIRMEFGQVAEVRGIGPEQNLESNMIEIARNKYQDLPGGNRFEKKYHDMKMLTAIEKKNNSNEKLSTNELRFLYGLDNDIEGFGQRDDPRIDEIKKNRNLVSDFSEIFNCSQDEITFNQEDALKGGIVYHHGYIDLPNLTSAKGLKLPKNVGGELVDLQKISSIEDLTLPEYIRGTLFLDGLTKADGLKLPKMIGGNLTLSGLTSAKGLTFPERVDGEINLSSLTSAKGLNLPQNMGLNLNLITVDDLENDLYIERYEVDLNLSGLTSAKYLKLPEKVGIGINLSGLNSIKNLTLPKEIGGSLDLSNINSIKDLKLPEKVGGYVILGEINTNDQEKLIKQYPKLYFIFAN